MNIGVFDSGYGGRFVANKLRQLLPDHNYRVVDDAAHAPYGERTYREIEALTVAAVIPLLDCDLVVIACNTATAATIDRLRRDYPDKTFVGFEPMIKSASRDSISRHVTLLTTRATGGSRRTKQLIQEYAADLDIDQPDTTGWAAAIDADKVESIDIHNIATSVDSGSDTIIVGCTHYIALIPRLQQIFPDVNILEPTEAVAQRISQLAISRQP